MIHVKVKQLFMSNVGFVVLLQGEKDPRSLPIFIGAAEAQAIAIQMNKVKMPRPLTHDLLKNLLDFLECRLMRIDVSDLSDGTFHATLHLEHDGKDMEMDCRPSDAIALALRYSAPIYVAKEVMDEAGQIFENNDLPADTGKEVSLLDSMKSDMKKAVEEERYEDAAKLRDKIAHIKTTHTDN